MNKKRTQRQIKRQAETLEAKIDAFSGRLSSFLEKNIRKLLKGIERRDITDLEAARILNGVRTGLDDLGLHKIFKELEDIYGEALGNVAEAYDLVSNEEVLVDADYSTVEALIKLDTSRIANRVYAVTDDLTTNIFNQVISGAVLDLSILDGASTKLQANVVAELNTATQGFSRAVTQAKARELGFTKFIYLGPDDKKTRPFCHERVDRIYTQEEIDGWDNGTDLPANIYLGGYNCRHQLRPVADDDTSLLEIEESE